MLFVIPSRRWLGVSRSPQVPHEFFLLIQDIELSPVQTILICILKKEPGLALMVPEEFSKIRQEGKTSLAFPQK